MNMESFDSISEVKDMKSYLSILLEISKQKELQNFILNSISTIFENEKIKMVLG